MNDIHTPPISNIDLHGITQDALKILDARSRDVVTRRFGLEKEKRETLESIGREYGITRERVRQIEANTKKQLSTLEETFNQVSNLFASIFSQYGGILAEDHAVELIQKHLVKPVSANIVRFHLEILPQFIYHSTTSLFGPHWRYASAVHPEADNIVVTATNLLKTTGHPLPLKELISNIQKKMAHGDKAAPSEQVVHAILEASKNIAPTAFGEWGLIGWAETSPRGVGDKAYAVLRQHGKPAHFREITNLINTAHFDHKKANPQTVHNELIKDNRFVLVGRGLYGLKEWGYMTGTVADVLESIMRKAQKPLTREELIQQVLEQRMVKKNTILLSLQNNKRFMRAGKNLYSLRTE